MDYEKLLVVIMNEEDLTYAAWNAHPALDSQCNRLADLFYKLCMLREHLTGFTS